MRKVYIILMFCITACSTPKSYFTTDIRKKVEGITDINKLQYYVDRDVELRRELSSGEINVTSGKVKFENGKYIHIILLKRYTPGICTKVYNNSIDISFEVGDGKKITFGVSDNYANSIYQIFATEWTTTKYGYGKIGKVTYDDKIYYIQPAGANAQLMIKKSIIDKLKIEKRVMPGIKVK